MLEMVGDEPLELFKCDKHDDVPWTEPRKCWNKPAAQT